MGDDRPSVYYEDANPGVLIIRASAIGSSCLWELVAAGQGYPPAAVPDNLQRAFDDGNRLEPVIIRMLEEELKSEVYGQQDEGHLKVTSNIWIRYHPDGYIRRAGFPVIVEAKALSDVLWQKAARWSVGDCIEEYKWQISVMMHANDMPALWAAYNKGNANGTPAPDKGRLLTETVLNPPISLEEITRKCLEIKELVDGDDIMASGMECGNPNQWPCRYLHIRPEPNQGWLEMTSKDDVIVSESSQPPVEMIDATLAISDDDKEEVDRLVREYLMQKGISDEAKQRADVARDRLIELSRNHKKVLTDKYLIPVIQGTNSSPDWASMPEEIRNEAKKYVKQTHYRYLKGIKNLGVE